MISTFTEEILNGKPHFLSSAIARRSNGREKTVNKVCP